MKKILLTIVTSLFICTGVSYSAENYLNTIILEGNGSAISNIVLRSDTIAPVKRVVENSDKIKLEVQGLKASDEISTMYKNTAKDNRIVVEQNNNDLIIQIQGKDVIKANIIFDSPATSPVVVSEGVSKKALGWGIFALLALCTIFVKSRKLDADSNERIKIAVRKNIRDREVEMYRNYRRELLTKPSIDYKITNPRMKRAIREADTIRHLQRMSRV